MEKKEQNTGQLQIRIQPSLYERFRKICEKKYASISSVVKDLIVKFVEGSEAEMGIYEHVGRLNVRYYDKDGKYLDHGRMIYKTLPMAGDIIHPFITIHGDCDWKVVEVKMPTDDTCFEIYVEDLGTFSGAK